MIIAIDIDDCMCNTLEYDFACGYMFNKKLNKTDNTLYIKNDTEVANTYGFSKEQEKEFFIDEKNKLMKKDVMNPKPFVGKVVNKLIKDGHTVYITTARENMYWNGSSYKYAKRWLRKNRIKYSKLIAPCSEKGKFCKDNKVNVLIEDKPKYAKQANENGIYSILLYQEHNKDYEHKLNLFASCWPEVYDKLEKINNNIDKK